MELTCQDVQRAIPWLLDDELDSEQVVAMEGHIAACGPCYRSIAAESRLRQIVRRASQSQVASDFLRRRVRDVLVQHRERECERGLQRYVPALMAAAVLMAFMWRGATGGFVGELDEVTSRHSMDLPMDVVANDATEVQSYLSSRLAFPVRLPQLGDTQIRDFGGRVIQLHDHKAAQLRYVTDHGRVSIFVYPLRQAFDSSEVVRFRDNQVVLRRVHGYTAAQWRAQGLVYAAVSEMPEQEFSAALRWVLNR